MSRYVAAVESVDRVPNDTEHEARLNFLARAGTKTDQVCAAVFLKNTAIVLGSILVLWL